MIHEVIEKWHLHMKGQLPGGLDELLDDNVFTPQEGKAITKLYLQAAGQTLPGEKKASGSPTNDDKSFRYIKEVLSGSTAVLEFETYVEGKYVNGIDMITCNEQGKITEFKVMIRPLQAINLVHKQMGEMLERMKP
jgi:hypothetical protein